MFRRVPPTAVRLERSLVAFHAAKRGAGFRAANVRDSAAALLDQVIGADACQRLVVHADKICRQSRQTERSIRTYGIFCVPQCGGKLSTVHCADAISMTSTRRASSCSISCPGAKMPAIGWAPSAPITFRGPGCRGGQGRGRGGLPALRLRLVYGNEDRGWRALEAVNSAAGIPRGTLDHLQAVERQAREAT
jgi:hypothetical protein